MTPDEQSTRISVAQGPPRVLLVDADPRLRSPARSAMEGLGLLVEEAASGTEALAALAGSPPELVVLDLEMRAMDGFEVCSRMRASRSGRHLPILVLTGRDDTESVKRAFELGATDFAVKPIDWHVLAHRLEYMLRSSRSAEQLQRSQRRLADAQRIARLGCWEWQVSSELMSLSQQMREILGLRSLAGPIRFEEFLGRIHAADRARVRATLQELVRSRQEQETAFRIVRPDRGERLVLQRAELQVGVGDEGVCVLATVQDVTERRPAAEQVREPATPDRLTGLPDRRSCLLHLETALAQAKRPGAQERPSLADDLEKALERGELLLHYQPQVELASGLIVGVEALLRWRHPESGILAAARFLPLAEATGLIGPIGEWVLASACRQVASWHRAGRAGLRLSVNVSMRQVADGDLARVVARVIAETGLDPRLLDLELCESLLLRADPDPLPSLEELKSLGLRLSVDDFGTASGSLSCLTRWPVDVLKIDRTVVQGLATTSGSVDLTRAILAVARSLGLEVIAEGIETPSEL